MFAPHVTLEVIDVADRNGETVVTTKVDGQLRQDRVPNPVIINHHIIAEGGTIIDVPAGR